MSQCCGECKWWSRDKSTKYSGKCQWVYGGNEKFPLYVTAYLDGAFTREDYGNKCPTFAPREDKHGT